MISLSLEAARTVLLGAQGLLNAPTRRPTKADVLAAIVRMGALQSDTINVVARSPYFVLWSRLGHYDTAWLDELLAEGSIFEQWSHEASFLPIEDFPLHRRLTIERTRGKQWIRVTDEEISQILEHVRERGAVRSADFERTDGKKGAWWDWKPEKRALEALFYRGDLMVARRENYHRVYDLRERLLPDWSDDRAPSLEDARRQQAVRAVRSLGAATPRWMADYFRTPKQLAGNLLDSLVETGELVRAEIEGIADRAYVHPDNLALAEQAIAGSVRSTVTMPLSPFDPVVWDRDRLKTLFGMEYRIECYTPAPKRKFGYFSLPILHRGAIVGRMDAKAHRKDRVFEVRAIYLEPGIEAGEPLVSELAAALLDCATWHGTPQVVVTRAEPEPLAAELRAEIARQAARREEAREHDLAR